MGRGDKMKRRANAAGNSARRAAESESADASPRGRGVPAPTGSDDKDKHGD